MFHRDTHGSTGLVLRSRGHRSGHRDERLLMCDASEHVLRGFDDEVSQSEDRRNADGADHRASKGEHDVAVQHAESDHDDAE